MAQQIQSIPLTGGHDLSAAPLVSNPASFRRLHNLRQNPDSPGRVEQTFPFYIHANIPPGPGEPATSAIRRIIKPSKIVPGTGYITFSDYSIYNTAVPERVPTYYFRFIQNTTTTTPWINQQATLFFTTLSPSSIFVGNTIELQVVSTSQFLWKKNGGVFNGPVSFTTQGVLVDGFIIYTLTGLGFQPGDVFRWTRTDRVADSGNPGDILDLVQYKDTVYYINADTRVMKLENVPDTNRYYAITAGYEALYAKHLSIFEDHLFLHPGGPRFQEFPHDLPTDADVANSDLGDLDAFVSTDINEADHFVIPVNTTFPFASNTVTGGGVVNNRLFVATESGIWYTDYIGLPIPFSFKRLRDFPGIIKVMTGLDCLYFYTNDGRLYRFDGTSITSYGANYIPLLNPQTEIWDVTIDRQNLVQYFFDRGNKQLLANDHSRSLDFPGGAPYCVSNLGDALYVGTANLLVLKEDRDYTHTPVPENGVPYLITQPIIGQSVTSAKEINGLYIGVNYDPTTGPAYALDDHLRVLVEYYNTDTGIPLTLLAGGTWSRNVEQNFVSLRAAFKSLLLKLTLESNTALPPGAVSITSLDIEGVNLQKAEPIKK